eukprot:m.217170 g.217170  ORF g.217170 m.217170 type:complete len:406 (+) comp28963_c0_seq1:164-1381(+)
MVPTFLDGTAASIARRRHHVVTAMQRSPVVRMIIGDAIGDAFGFEIEMQDALWIRQNVRVVDGWPHNPAMPVSWAANRVTGMYSDDTEMTVGLMKGLMKDGIALDMDGMLRAWRDEWELSKQRPPPATPNVGRQGHGSIRYVFQGTKTIAEVRASQARRTNPGNAPPMRSLPLCFFPLHERARLCVANAHTTHPHPRAVAASWVIATAARYLAVEHGPPDRLLEVVIASLRDTPSVHDAATVEHLTAVSALPDYHIYGPRLQHMPPAAYALLCGPQPHPIAARFKVRGGADGRAPMHGLWTDAMRTAGVVMYLVRYHRGPADVLQAAVDIGGDVDSIAALCLGMVLAGPCDGERVFGDVDGGEGTGVLPWVLLDELEGAEYLVDVAERYEAWLTSQGYHGPSASL